MIEAHGVLGKLVNRVAAGDELKKAMQEAADLPQLIIAERFVSDIELITNGALSPLTGFMSKADVDSVVSDMQLADGTLWAIPVVLPVTKDQQKQFNPGDKVTLLNNNKQIIAIMDTKELFTIDPVQYAIKIYGTDDSEHPGIKLIAEHGYDCISGNITLLSRPERETIDEKYYMDPERTREAFHNRGWSTVVAFQTRNPIHRAHEHIIKSAMEIIDGALIHPLVGATKSDDIPANVRMQCYEVLIEKYFNPENVYLTVLPAAMRYAGPREAIHHMIMRQNYGCSHMIIGRDHAGVGDYYGTYEAQELVDTVKDRLKIKPLNFEHAFYCKITETTATSKTSPSNVTDRVHLSGTKVRQMLQEGVAPPPEFSRPEVAKVLIAWATSK